MSSGTSGMDIRLPMGLMFTIMGAIISIYGGVTRGNDMYKIHSLGININLWWGLILLAFGLFMLLMAVRAQKKAADAPPANHDEEQAGSTRGH